MTVDLDALEKLADEKFMRAYPEAVRRGDWEHIARLLSGRLRQMDKRAKAANVRSDALIAELKEAHKLLARIDRVYADLQDGNGNHPTELRKVRAFLAKAQGGE
jgi:hypothetical protein